MARIASQAVGGYFPTPGHLVPLIAALLEPSDHVLTFLDPCAGEGDALIKLSVATAKVANIVGIEMEKTRYKALREKVGEGSDSYVYYGDAFAYERTHGEAQVLYLNPPYDMDPLTGRLEEKFLRRFAPHLSVGGALLFVVPFYALSESAETLAKHFTDLAVYRFPEKEFQVFKQVVLVGVKRPPLDHAPSAEVAKIKGWSVDVSSCPALGEEEPTSFPSRKIHVVSPSRYTPAISFKKIPVDVESLSKEFLPWNVVDRRGQFVPLPNVPRAVAIESVLKKTYPMAMPPRVAHIAMAVASGIFNGSLVTPDDPASPLPPLLVKGVFDKEWKEVGEKRNKEGEITGYKEQQQPKLVVTVFDTKWQQFHTLPAATAPHASPPSVVADMNVADLLTLYGKSLMKVMMEQCPVLHDPAHDKDRFPLVPMKGSLYPAQEEAVRANIKLLGGPSKALTLKNKYAFLLGELGSGKTFAAIATGVNIGARRILVVCPPHLLAEWENEVKKFCPSGKSTCLSDVVTLDRWAGEKLEEGVISFGLLSRESAKLGHGWVGVDKCPKCLTPVPAGVDVVKKRYRCKGKAKSPKNDFSASVLDLARDLLPLFPASSNVVQLIQPKMKYKRREEAKASDFQRLAQFIPAMDLFFGTGNDLAFTLLEVMLAAVGDPGVYSETLLRAYGKSMDHKETWGPWQKVRDWVRGQIFAVQDPELRSNLIASLKALGKEPPASSYFRTDPWQEVDEAHVYLEIKGEGAGHTHLLRDHKILNGAWTTRGYPHRATATLISAVEQLVASSSWEEGEECGEFLYQAVAEPKRYPLAKYLIKNWSDSFDFLILDECQELSSTQTAQGKAAHRLTALGKPTLLMTGTGMNGYADSLFGNLWSCNREFRNEFDRNEEQAFVDRYGYRTRVVEEKDRKENADYGAVTDREARARITGIAPGVLPLLILKWILPWATTLHKTDLEEAIPTLTQERVSLTPDPSTQKSCEDMARKIVDQIRKDQFDEEKSGKLFGAMAQLPSYLDLCTKDTGNQSDGSYEVRYPESVGRELLTVGLSLPASTLLEKERWMVQKVKEELAAGHDVMIWAWHRQLLPRYQRILEAHLLEKVALLDPAKVNAKKRRAWIDKEVVQKKIRVMVVNPMAIQTGLNNLVSFSRVIVMENPACNPIIYRQAVGRIDRIGQKKETKVYFPVYEGSLQDLAHKLLFTKVAVSQVVDGLDAAGSMEASGMGDIDVLASLSIGRALAEMYLNSLRGPPPASGSPQGFLVVSSRGNP